ncbi:DUF1320 family protein [Flammeovirga sp. MY04]|uniref:DUF1320 family protein n=1 Tax=Flammeovirga sp. MY04 TaxID=1191459 RepID=UPI00080618F7|nr:DUF1320 family protein [Flammeovirga sp. MY04]ANQ49607.1 DUF1320 family protein [Flammeovirga sp. MY04]ANQ52125.1 DUF1320 family protein [Flammeovirga sp. MY04]
MFITYDEMSTVIYQYSLTEIATQTDVEYQIAAAVQEMTSYLYPQYDTDEIFSAVGDDRNPLLVEFGKSIAIYYVIRVCNSDYLFEKAQLYYDNAIAWLTKVAENNAIAPNLPLKKDEDGETKIKNRYASNPKFTHTF